MRSNTAKTRRGVVHGQYEHVLYTIPIEERKIHARQRFRRKLGRRSIGGGVHSAMTYLTELTYHMTKLGST